MTLKWRKIACTCSAAIVAGVLSAPAFSTPLHPNPKCNSGGGNGSEIVGTTDCDPGNSGANNGGD